MEDNNEINEPTHDYKPLPSSLEPLEKKHNKETKSKNHLDKLPNSIISAGIAPFLRDAPTEIEERKGNSLQRFKETSRRHSGREGKKAMRRKVFFYSERGLMLGEPCMKSAEYCLKVVSPNIDDFFKSFCFGDFCSCLVHCGTTLPTCISCALLALGFTLLGGIVGCMGDGIAEVKQCLKEEPLGGYIDYNVTKDKDLGSPPVQHMK